MSAPVPPALPPTGPAASTSAPTSTPPSSSQTAPTAARGTVLSLPANVTLTQGQALSAQVISSGNGQLVLATHLGRITVQSTVSLAPGTSILLQVQAAGDAPQVTLHLPSTAGTLPGTPQGAPTRSAGAPTGPMQQASQPVTTHLTEGSVVQAAVTRAAQPPASGTPSAAVNAPLAGRPPTTPSGAPPPATQSTGATLVAGTNLTLRVMAVSPPGTELPPAASLVMQSGGRMLAATVLGRQPGGAPIATTGTAELVLSNAPPLPTGSRLLLEVLTLRSPALGEPGAPPSLFGGRWETLNETLAMLQRIDPALARQIADGVIPTPGPRLAGSMLFFLSAVLSGEVRRFLDADAMRHLTRAPGGLGARLSAEMSQMQRTATDASGQDWRLFFVPVLTDARLEQLRFMLRKDEGEGKGPDQDAGTRFMIEADMSRLGPFQFDGLARRKHLDLVIRTHAELPPEMREEIRSIFGNTITALGFTGTIAFRAVPKFEIAPVEKPTERPKDLTV